MPPTLYVIKDTFVDLEKGTGVFIAATEGFV
jgi:hypothetical protein